MLHITGKSDTLKDLKEKEEFQGSLSEYNEKFNQANQSLKVKIIDSAKPIPSFIPIFPVTQPLGLDPDIHTNALEIAQYSFNERQTLWHMQEHGVELPIVQAGKDIISDYAQNISSFRKKLNDPIIQTPWNFWNESVTNDAILDMISEGLLYKSTSIKMSPLFQGLEKFETNMITLDALQTQYEPLRRVKGSKALRMRRTLERHVDECQGQIKQQVRGKVESHLSKHLRSRYNQKELEKMERLYFGERLAQKGKLKTSYLDLVNRTDLNRMRKLIPQFKNLGNKVGKVSTCVAWAAIGYDTLDTALQRDFEKAIRNAAAGSSGLWTGMAVTAYVIGSAGTTFLISTPFGWAVVVVAGIAAGGYVGSRVTEVVDYRIGDLCHVAKRHYPYVEEKISLTYDFFSTCCRILGESLTKD